MKTKKLYENRHLSFLHSIHSSACDCSGVLLIPTNMSLPSTECCKKCAGIDAPRMNMSPRCWKFDCPCHKPTITSTGGKTVYVKALPFHRPASAVSQSPIEKCCGWCNFNDINGEESCVRPDCPHCHEPTEKRDIRFRAWEEALRRDFPMVERIDANSEKKLKSFISSQRTQSFNEGVKFAEGTKNGSERYLMGHEAGIDAAVGCVEKERYLTHDLKQSLNPCTFFTDHEPVWDGNYYTCAKCGIEFLPARDVNKTIEKTLTALRTLKKGGLTDK